MASGNSINPSSLSSAATGKGQTPQLRPKRNLSLGGVDMGISGSINPNMGVMPNGMPRMHYRMPRQQAGMPPPIQRGMPNMQDPRRQIF